MDNKQILDAPPTRIPPLSLLKISQGLDAAGLPEEPLDPNGDWDQYYTVWLALYGEMHQNQRHGYMRLRRAVKDGGKIELSVNQVTWGSGGQRGISDAVLTCTADVLATPRQWQMQSTVTLKDKTVANTRVRISGRAESGRIVQRLNKQRATSYSGNLTTNWSLFDAVQRLPFDTKPLSFSMLEDLELLKPGQRLYYAGSVEFPVGGKQMKLHSFEQLGWGIIPYTYWLDESHRLIVAIGSLRAYVLDSKAGGSEAGR